MKLRCRIEQAITNCEAGDPYEIIKMIEHLLDRDIHIKDIIELGRTQFSISPENSMAMLCSVELIAARYVV